MEREKIKDEFLDILNEYNSSGRIEYDVYSELMDVGVELLDRMYESGKENRIGVSEDEGTLMVHKFNVGDTVYIIENGDIIEDSVCEINLNKSMMSGKWIGSIELTEGRLVKFEDVFSSVKEAKSRLNEGYTGGNIRYLYENDKP